MSPRDRSQPRELPEFRELTSAPHQAMVPLEKLRYRKGIERLSAPSPGAAKASRGFSAILRSVCGETP